MESRYGGAVRLLGIALLLLAVSPLTAPFSTCDLIDILGGATPAGTSVHAKAAPDEPAADVGSAHGLAASVGVSPASVKGAVRDLRSSVPLTVPLRV